MKPLVSVTVVTYNHIDFIRDCLDSILSQDYPNFEICIADDFSTDGAADVIQIYADKYPDIIKFIRGKKNIGPTKNCNLALRAIKGKYCSMIAGDDLMLPGKLNSQVDFMENDPTCRISYHNSEIVDTVSGKLLGYSKFESFSGVGDFDDLLSKGSFIGACEAMFRTEHMPSYGLDERLVLGADWKFHLDILESGGYVKFVDQVLAKHLRHSKNITSDRDPLVELQRFQDLVTTCGLMLAKHPEKAKLIRRRLAVVLRQMRNIHDRKNYRRYLCASNSMSFNVKATFAIFLSYFGVFR